VKEVTCELVLAVEECCEVEELVEMGAVVGRGEEVEEGGVDVLDGVELGGSVEESVVEGHIVVVTPGEIETEKEVIVTTEVEVLTVLGKLVVIVVNKVEVVQGATHPGVATGHVTSATGQTVVTPVADEVVTIEPAIVLVMNEVEEVKIVSVEVLSGTKTETIELGHCWAINYRSSLITRVGVAPLSLIKVSCIVDPDLERLCFFFGF
jgi:hypothetical protein